MMWDDLIWSQSLENNVSQPADSPPPSSVLSMEMEDFELEKISTKWWTQKLLSDSKNWSPSTHSEQVSKEARGGGGLIGIL